jgi:hypothetical protein
MNRPGYIDPGIVPVTSRDRALLRAIRIRGFTLHKLHSGGTGVRLIGPGVHVVAAGLRSLNFTDLDSGRHDGN